MVDGYPAISLLCVESLRHTTKTRLLLSVTHHKSQKPWKQAQFLHIRTHKTQNPKLKYSYFPAKATWQSVAVWSSNPTTKRSIEMVSYHPSATLIPPSLCLSAALKWEQADEPPNTDIDTTKVCDVGLGMSLANVLRWRMASSLGLVPCAVGGIAIKEQVRGEHLYENMIKRAKESSKGNGQREIKALFWYQGESDSLNEHATEAYKVNMEKLIHNVREDLNLLSLPIIQVCLYFLCLAFCKIVQL